YRAAKGKAPEYERFVVKLRKGISKLLDKRGHVVGFAAAFVEGAGRTANPAKIGAHGKQPGLDTGAGQRCHDLVAARPAIQRMRVQLQGRPAWRRRWPGKGAIEGARASLEYIVRGLLCHRGQLISRLTGSRRTWCESIMSSISDWS